MVDSETETETYLQTPTQASELVGVPVVQLLRWAVLGQGPRNSGTKHKPLYTEEDLVVWLDRIRGVMPRKECTERIAETYEILRIF